MTDTQKRGTVRLPADDERLTRMLKALGNPVRFRIMQTLAERQMCITQHIVDLMPLAQSTVSQHLKVLREAGLIRGEIEGPATCYCLDPDGVRWLKGRIEGWLARCCAATSAGVMLDAGGSPQPVETVYATPLHAGDLSASVRDAILALGYLRPEMVVADVGCGTGSVAAVLAPRVRRVYALDSSAASLSVAQQNLAAFGNITYQQVDGWRLPLPDASLDAVFAHGYLCQCPDPITATRELARVLKPSGRLVISEVAAYEHEQMREEMADRCRSFRHPQIKAWLREAGLVNVLVSYVQQGDVPSQANPAQRAPEAVLVATGTRRVSGAQAAVRANYDALAEGGRGCCPPASASGESVREVGLSEGGCCMPAASASGFVAEIRLTGTCCAPTDAVLRSAAADAAVDWDTGYTPEQLATVPAESAAMSLGCGNPTAIASLRPGEVVLDIGSGGGIDAFYAAQRVGPTGRVIGVDMSPAMIERARRAASRMGLTNVEFRLGQAEALPLPDSTADVVISNCVINLCEDKGLAFEEIFRVLKPGGRLAISDMVTDGPLPLTLRSDPGAWAGCISGALPEREYLALVAAAGFTDVHSSRSQSGGRVADVAVYSLSVSARKEASAMAQVPGARTLPGESEG